MAPGILVLLCEHRLICVKIVIFPGVHLSLPPITDPSMYGNLQIHAIKLLLFFSLFNPLALAFSI